MFTLDASRPLQAALFAAALAAITAASAPAAAQAGSASPAARRDPLNAGEPVPAVQHRSVLTTYRANADQPLGSWRQANDTVTRVGGWRAYAREASQPDAPAAASPAASAPAGTAPAASKPAPAGHAGHGKP